MDINSSQANRNSEQEFVSKFSTFVDSGAGIIHVRTNEVLRACIAIRKQGISDGASVSEWDVVNGFRSFNHTNATVMVEAGDGEIDVNTAFLTPLTNIRSNPHDSTARYYVYVNPHVFMEGNPYISQLLSVYNHVLPSSSCVVVLVTPDVPLPMDNDNILTLRFDPPGLLELQESLQKLISEGDSGFENNDIEKEDLDRVCYVGAGMTKGHFETYAALAIVQAGREGKDTIEADDLIKGVSLGKTEVVNSSDILELYPSTDIDNVGGLDNLKGWIARRRNCYSDEAREFGVEPPKGIVLVGPPGTGKSLVAKAVSSELGVPLVRLDFGRVFNSLVGASENRMRSALRMVESMSPCVLFCDEIDKGLGGIGSGGDSGVSNRVLGSFLTWLQDCNHPVFVMVTANNVTGLPPEMLRRGRFDAIFSTSMPSAQERMEVLRIHLKKRGRDITEFPKAEVKEIVAMSEGYVPAEIESAVKDGLVDAFAEGDDFAMSHVQSALKAMVPLSKAFAKQIDAMNTWAKENATPAGAVVKTEDLQSVANARRVSTRRRQ